MLLTRSSSLSSSLGYTCGFPGRYPRAINALLRTNRTCPVLLCYSPCPCSSVNTCLLLLCHVAALLNSLPPLPYMYFALESLLALCRVAAASTCLLSLHEM